LEETTIAEQKIMRASDDAVVRTPWPPPSVSLESQLAVQLIAAWFQETL
jgi:hypothetical protein